MNANQIASKLKSKGFKVSQKDGYVFVGLNRRVEISEVLAALNFEVEQERMTRAGKEVVIIGPER